MTRRILVTRPAAQAGELSDLLRARGLEPVEVPTVEIDSASAQQSLDGMLDALPGADWIVLTSANGAEALVDRLAANGHRLPDGIRVAAVGPATAAALRDGGIAVDHVPDEYLTVTIAAGLGPVDGRRIVLARADAATDDLRLALQARGARVEEVVAYRTVEGPEPSRRALRAALADRLDGLAFTSGSTVRGFHALLDPTDRPRAIAIPAFAIGPVTARVAGSLGFTVAAVAAEHTAPGLASTVAGHFEGDR